MPPVHCFILKMEQPLEMEVYSCTSSGKLSSLNCVYNSRLMLLYSSSDVMIRLTIVAFDSPRCGFFALLLLMSIAKLTSMYA